MKLQSKDEELIVLSSSYSVIFWPSERTFFYYRKGILLYTGSLDVLFDSVESEDTEGISLSYNYTQTEENICVTFEVNCGNNTRKILVFSFFRTYFLVSATINGPSRELTNIRFFSSHSSSRKPKEYSYIAPRFDWFVGKVERNSDEDEILSCQQWFSPPPFCYIYTDRKIYSAIGVASPLGKQNYTAFLHVGKDDSFVLQYEGHTKSEGEFSSPALVFCPEDTSWDAALKLYREILEQEQCIARPTKKTIPRWWKEPIFCGWGEMRYEYRIDHDQHENGNFINVTDYCMQSRYERYLHIFEEKDINPGTVIIDMGWAEFAALGKPDPHKWPSLRSFIDIQHKKGRHVLLWFTPMVTQGLPLEACLVLNDRPVAPDPTNPLYVEILQKQLHLMLSSDPGSLDADGFKIDFTQNNPSEEGVFTGYINSFWGLINTNIEKHLYTKRDLRSTLIQVYESNVWGVDLLHRYLENIYVGMKKIKKDSLLITHTPNPSFADVSDMLRLNDLDGECDNVLEVMSSRAKIANAGNPEWLIDTDNDLMIDKAHWRDYIALQPRLGIPDTYYATHIATSCEAFDDKDYALLRRAFSEYRATLG